MSITRSAEAQLVAAVSGKMHLSYLENLNKKEAMNNKPAQMSTHQCRVQAMHRQADLYWAAAPESPPSKIRVNRLRLLLEEVFEVADAAGVVIASHSSEHRLRFDDLSFWAMKDDMRIDLPHLAKELADVRVIATGGLVECGIADEAVQEAVDLNNLGKCDPTCGAYVHPQTGKLTKPPNYPKPDIASVLRDQGWVDNPEVLDECNTQQKVLLPSGTG